MTMEETYCRDHKNRTESRSEGGELHLACCFSLWQNELLIQQQAAEPGSLSGSALTTCHTNGPGKQCGPAASSTSQKNLTSNTGGIKGGKHLIDKNTTAPAEHTESVCV